MTKEKFISQTEILSRRLLKLGRIYAMARNYTPSTVWHYACSNPDFSEVLENRPGVFKIGTYDKIVQYFSNHWPADYDWPTDIDRPPVTGDDEHRAPASQSKRKAAAVGAAKKRIGPKVPRR